MSDFLIYLLGDFTFQYMIECITLGIIFITIIRFIIGLKNKNSLLLSFIIGYILSSMYKHLEINFVFMNQILIQILCTIILAYIIGMIFKSNIFENLLRKLGITKGIYDLAWDDVYDSKPFTAKIGFAKLNCIYFGQVTLLENNKEFPKIILSNISLYDYSDSKLENPIYDYSSKPNYQVILDTAKADFVELYFSDDGNKAKIDI